MTDQDLNRVPLDEIWHLFKESSARYAKFLEERIRVLDKRLEARGQFFAPATIKIRPQKINETAEEEPRPPAVSVETKSVVGLEERIRISESETDLENGSSEGCSNDEQDQFIVLAEQTTPIDMIIGDTADMEKSRSAKLFELKAETGEIIMPGGHNNCSTHSAVESKKFTKSEIFGENYLFGLERNQVENFNIKISRLGIKHRWPPPVYDSATFLSMC